MEEASSPAKLFVDVPPRLLSARPRSEESAEKSRLEVMNGNSAPAQAAAPDPDAAMAADTTGDPRSNSWLPRAEALTPIAFMIATSGRPSAVVPMPATLFSAGSAPPTSQGPGIQVSPSASTSVFAAVVLNFSTIAPRIGAVLAPSVPDSP